MSHFTVLIIGNNVEKQLYPYWELDLTKEDMAKDSRAKFKVEITKTEMSKICEAELPKTIARYSRNDAGDYGYYHNPNAKWDWYSIGGRWAGFFTMKDDKGGILGEPSWTNENEEIAINKADQAFKSDIDFEGMRAERNADAWKWWRKYEAEKDEGNTMLPYLSYGVKEDDTKESYIARQTNITTFAVIKEGKWYERGEMGWWGMTTNEKDNTEWQREFDALLESLPDDTLLTVVDCHI